MVTFDDLQFVKTMSGPQMNRWNAQLEIGNGLTLSVAYGDMIYSTQKGDEPQTYEVALFFGNDFVPLQVYDDVIGWMSPEEIDSLIKEIQSDPEFVKKRIDAKEEYQKELNETE